MQTPREILCEKALLTINEEPDNAEVVTVSLRLVCVQFSIP